MVVALLISALSINRMFCVLIQRPPISTRTDTLFPYTTLFRSSVGEVMAIGRTFQEWLQKALRGLETGKVGLDPTGLDLASEDRSEERRVGKECVSTCRSRCSPYH